MYMYMYEATCRYWGTLSAYTLVAYGYPTNLLQCRAHAVLSGNCNIYLHVHVHVHVHATPDLLEPQPYCVLCLHLL